LIFTILDWYAIDLIIMQITLGADSVAPNPSVLVPPEFDVYSAAIWMVAIMQYGGRAQYSNILIFLIFKLPFYNMAARALFLNITQHFTIR